MIRKILQYLKPGKGDSSSEISSLMDANFGTIKRMLSERKLDVILYPVDTAWHSWNDLYEDYVRVYAAVRKGFKELGGVNAEVYSFRPNMSPETFEEYSTLLDLSLNKMKTLHQTIYEDVMFPQKLENLHEDISVVKVVILPTKKGENSYDGGVIPPREAESGRYVRDYVVIKSDKLDPGMILHYLGHMCGLTHVTDGKDVMFSPSPGCPSEVHSHKFGRKSKERWSKIKRYFS